MPQVAPVGGITLTGPDGTAVTFGDASSPSFVGFIDPDNGWGGLLDTADVRATADNRVEGHGQVQGNSWLAGRSGTLQGILIAPDIATYNAFESKLKRASRGLSASQPCMLTWTPDGGAQRQMSVYRQGRVVRHLSTRSSSLRLGLERAVSLRHSRALSAPCMPRAGRSTC